MISASNEKMAKQVEEFESLLKSKNVLPSNYLEDYSHTVDEDWTAKNGAQLVARAWIDSNFKKRLLENGIDAANGAVIINSVAFPSAPITLQCL